jgi:DNA-binding transcriptional regulator YiaG
MIKFTGTEPTLSELAEASGLSRRRVKEIIVSMQVEGYLDEAVFDASDSATRLGQLPDEKRASPAEIVHREIFSEQFSSLLSSALDEREAFILKRRLGLFDDSTHTLAEIGKELGISRERVRQIEQEVLDRIKARSTSEDSLIEAIQKLSTIHDAQKNCLVCGRKLISNEHKYCSDQCRRKVIYEQGGISPKEIRAKRKALMLTQAQLAEKIGVTKETIRTWEHGINKPNFEHYDKLYSFFDKHNKEIEEVRKVKGSSLRNLREELGLSQNRLADFLGVSKVTVGNWERNRHEPDFVYQKKLMEIFQNPQIVAKACLPPHRQEKAPQLMLFDVSLYAKSKAKQRKAKRIRRRSATKEVESQFALW